MVSQDLHYLKASNYYGDSGSPHLKASNYYGDSVSQYLKASSLCGDSLSDSVYEDKSRDTALKYFKPLPNNRS
jgi:hypothetical protein